MSPIGSYIIYYYSFTFYRFLTKAYKEGATLIDPSILLDKSVYSSYISKVMEGVSSNTLNEKKCVKSVTF